MAAPSTAVEFDVAVRPLRVLTVLAVVFGTASVLASAWHQDQTSDEPYHMKWARRLLSERVSERASSPLWNSKTPVMAAHVLSKWAGRRLLGVRGRAATFWGRLPGLAAYLGVLTLAYGFGRSRLGERTALLACALLALDPNLIANSAVATVDAPYTLTTLLTLAAGVRMAERPSFGRAALLGAALGLCFATKFTAFLLLPGLLFLLACYGVRALGGGRRALALGSVVALAAVAVLDAAYLGVGVARPLDALTWKSELMGQLAQALPRLRLPLPADFLTPATVQRAAFALAGGFALLGLGQLATAAGLRRGARWSYAAAVMGGLFVAFTAGATAIFMIAARSAQPQAATLLTVGAIGLGGVAALYGAIAVLVAGGRRELEVSTG